MLAAGHASNLDPWALGLPLWPRRFLRFMAKSELFWFPLGPLIRACGAFKVRRGRGRLGGDPDGRSTSPATGHVIAMFPEGTRRKKGLRKTRQAQAHTGAARIALEAGVPLVPAGIKGTDDLRTPRSRGACATAPPVAARRPRRARAGRGGADRDRAGDGRRSRELEESL